MDERPADLRVYQPLRRRRGSRAADVGPLHQSECATFAGRVQIQLERGNFQAAREVIDDAERAVRDRVCVTLETKLAETELSELSILTLNSLEKVGITTVGDVLHCTRDRLLGVKQLGRTRVEQLILLAGKWAQCIQDQTADSVDF